ncbi:endonuclease NucS domain-containing protein [Halobiforma nitratireducens]|uniref:endonuclease NucS domain-containing protein n=1 Tax=Halobiforma nitratireducens TaxID=130048 RepID=UPI00135F1586|nr:endonuclease NucS domain-containing protein [Halobiforma nitratireducens]
MSVTDSPNQSDQNSNGESTFRQYGPVVVFCVGLGLLLAHAFLPETVNIDWWTILLLAILALLPFFADIKELVLTPDEGLRITKTTGEIKDQVESTKESAIEKLRKRIENLEKEDEEEPVENKINTQLNEIRSEIYDIARDQSPELAFFELMRRLERELRSVLEKEGVQNIENAGLGKLTQLAEQHEILGKDLIINLEDVRPLRNRVAHGEEVETAEVEEMIELGLDLLEALLYDRETANITEQAILDAILQNPEIVEEGFEPITTQQRTEYGVIDLVGEDREGNKVLVEIKSHTVDHTHLKQLISLREARKNELGDNTRAILIAPSASGSIREFSEERITVKEIDLRDLRHRSEHSYDLS